MGTGGKLTTDIDLRVSKRLRAARMMAGISQEKAGEHLGLTFQQLQKYERGANRISAGKLAMLAQFYGKPVEWFFDGVGPNLANLEPDITAEFFVVPHATDFATALLKHPKSTAMMQAFMLMLAVER